MKVIFSGIQPTGCIHIGNYIGAIKQWIYYQNIYKSIFCVVDLHTLTNIHLQNTKSIKQRTLETIALYLACGINSDKSLIFVQSHIKWHTQLSWILNCITPLSWLRRMTQYKTKIQDNSNAFTGLMNYPILMASDILLYNATLIPVGEDQKQHIEFTTKIAMRFNNIFGKTFNIPRSLVPSHGARIMGFDDPSIKMSKSHGYDNSTHLISLLDTSEKIKKIIMSATTDSNNILKFSTSSLGIKNLFNIAQALSGESIKSLEHRFSNKGYYSFKMYIVTLILNFLNPIKKKYLKIINDKEYIDKILNKSTIRANNIAKKTIKKVYNKIGIFY